MAGRFSDAWLDELRSRVSIEEIVSEYVPLKRKGRRSWGLCPFHNEKTPSFSVDTETQLFYCFGCHKGGTVIQFVMEMERLDFSEAVKLLAERAHLPLLCLVRCSQRIDAIADLCPSIGFTYHQMPIEIAADHIRQNALHFSSPQLLLMMIPSPARAHCQSRRGQYHYPC